MKASILRWALGGCALLPLIAQAATQLHLPAPKPAGAAPVSLPMLLQADEVVYDGDNKTVAALGHVEINDQGRTLLADRVEYNQATDTVTASGHVSTTDAKGNVAFSDHVVLTDHMRDGALSGFGALIGKSGRLAANSAQRIGGTVVVARHGAYSPCVICNKPGGSRVPLWQVKAERIVYDQTKHKVRFSSATIEIKGVPVVWVPSFSVPDPTVRYNTGLLTPEVGNSTKIGYFIRTPIYVSLSSSQDMTIAPMVSTSGGEVLEAEYRARWNNGGMWFQGSGAYNPNGGLSGSPGPQTYGHLFGAGRQELGDNWRAGFDVQTTTNNGYMRFYDISFLDRLVNDLFVEDTPGRSRFALSSYYFQGLRSTDVTSRIPFVLPKLEFSWIPTQKVAGGSLRFDINSVAIGRDNQRNDQRVTSEINWKKLFLVGNGQLWTLEMDGRGDAYHFDVPTGTARTTDSTLERGTAYVALDWRWPFVSSGSNGRSYVVQPVAQFIAQPYGGNPTGLRIEDSQDFEFDDNNLFSINQVPGYDLIESGPRANVGMMAQAIFPGGEVDAQAGQTYRVKPDPKFTAFSGNSGTSSDLVGSLSVKFPHLDITDRVDLDRGNGNVRRHEIYVTGSYNRSSLQFSYVQLPTSVVSIGLPSRQQLNAQADINLWDNWQVFAAAQRDLQADEFLNTEWGLGYEDECLAISLAYRRKYTQDLILGVPPSTSVILRFSLKTGDEAIQPFSLFPKDVFALTHP
jgi:LPS-assembly protein